MPWEDARSAQTTYWHKLPYLRNINVRWWSVELGDLLEMYFEQDEQERFGLKSGDVLVCEGGEPGRAAVWTDQMPNLKFQKALHRLRCANGLHPSFLVAFLEYMAKSSRLERYFTGSTIKHFTGESFAAMPLPLPPAEEQIQIVALVSERLSQIDSPRRCSTPVYSERHTFAKASSNGPLRDGLFLKTLATNQRQFRSDATGEDDFHEMA